MIGWKYMHEMEIHIGQVRPDCLTLKIARNNVTAIDQAYH